MLDTESLAAVCVLVSEKPWHKAMVDRLSARTGLNFVCISSPGELTVDTLAAIQPRFVFFPHWSHVIEPAIHDRFECVIFHMTDLPFGRGGSPLQNLIARGIYETRLSAIRCEAEMDAGAVYLKKPLSLYGSAEEIFIRSAEVVEDMIVEIIESNPLPMPQQGDVTVFKRRKPRDGGLAAANSLSQAFDLIRMLDAEGYPNAFATVGPFKLEFSRAARKTDHLIADVRITLIENPESENR